MASPLYNAIYKTGCNDLNAKGTRKGDGSDSQENTAEDTLSHLQYSELMTYLLTHPGEHAARDMAMGTHLFSCVGRSDEGRLTFLCDIVKPRRMWNIGNATSLIIGCP